MERRGKTDRRGRMSLVGNADSTTATTAETPVPEGEAAATSTIAAAQADETATATETTASQEAKDANVPEARRHMAGKTSTCGTFVYGGDSSPLGRRWETWLERWKATRINKASTPWGANAVPSDSRQRVAGHGSERRPHSGAELVFLQKMAVERGRGRVGRRASRGEQRRAERAGHMVGPRVEQLDDSSELPPTRPRARSR